MHIKLLIDKYTYLCCKICRLAALYYVYRAKTNSDKNRFIFLILEKTIVVKNILNVLALKNNISIKKSFFFFFCNLNATGSSWWLIPKINCTTDISYDHSRSWSRFVFERSALFCEINSRVLLSLGVHLKKKI